MSFESEKEPLRGVIEALVSRKQLLFTTFCFFGVQFGWALQIALLTPFILELGMPDTWVTLVWLCGPVSGLVMQPLVGVFSDHSTSKWGRRRPYIVIGAVFIIFSLLLIPNSPDLGRILMGDSKHHNPGAISLAILGFWILDLANNTLQGPCRALIADIAPDSQQELGNGYFSLWLAVGNMSGYAAGWAPWSTWMPFWKSESCDSACADLRCAFTMSIFLCILAVIVTCLNTKEKQFGGKTRPPVFRRLWELLKDMPSNMRRVCLVNFFVWFAFFTAIIYCTTWVGTSVFHGDPHAGKHTKAYKDFTEGTRWGSFGLAIFAALSGVLSPFVPRWVKRWGARKIWLTGNVSLTLILLFTPIAATNVYLAVGLIGLLGYPWTVTMVVPFAAAAQIAPRDEKGIYVGVLNIFVVLPQFCVAFLGPFASAAYGTRAPQAVLFCGGLVGIISCLVIPVIPPHLGKEKRSEDENEEEEEEEMQVLEQNYH